MYTLSFNKNRLTSIFIYYIKNSGKKVKDVKIVVMLLIII